MLILRRLRRSYQAFICTEEPVATAEEPASPAWKSPPVVPPVLKEGQIDVRDLIARYDAARHVELADAYFEPRMDNIALRRKPFIVANEMIHILTAFAHVVDGLRLFPQLRLLDFGAGTAWSSRYLASLGCQYPPSRCGSARRSRFRGPYPCRTSKISNWRWTSWPRRSSGSSSWAANP